MKIYNLLNSSYNVKVYCNLNQIDIQDVTEEQLSFLKLIFPDQLSIREIIPWPKQTPIK